MVGMEKVRIDAVIFDMDGLLFDSERIIQRSWNAAGEQLGLGSVGEQIYHTIGMNLKSRTQFFHSVYGEDFPDEEFASFTRSFFRRIADTEGVPLKPGAVELLSYLREKKLKLAVATSSRREYSERLLKDGGIYSYFSGLICGDMVANSKPDPEIYLTACSILDVPPKYAMALEDAPNGIRAAHAAGLYPVMVPDLVQPSEEVLALTYRKLSTLHEVITLLDEAKE